MKCMDKHEFEQQNVFGTGAANTAYAKFFIGQSFLNPLTDPKTGLFLATLPLSPAAATTGTSTTRPRATAGSATLLWKFPAKIAATNGASPLPTKSTPN